LDTGDRRSDAVSWYLFEAQNLAVGVNVAKADEVGRHALLRIHADDRISAERVG
jgi:hypothetical protein